MYASETLWVLSELKRKREKERKREQSGAGSAGACGHVQAQGRVGVGNSDCQGFPPLRIALEFWHYYLDDRLLLDEDGEQQRKEWEADREGPLRLVSFPKRILREYVPGEPTGFHASGWFANLFHRGNLTRSLLIRFSRAIRYHGNNFRVKLVTLIFTRLIYQLLWNYKCK